MMGVRRCEKSTSSAGFQVKSVLGRNLLWEFGVVKNLHLLQVFM